MSVIVDATEDSATKLQVPGDVSKSAAGKSSYKRTGIGGAAKKLPDAESQEKKEACPTCGRKDHYGCSMTSKDCPAL